MALSECRKCFPGPRACRGPRPRPVYGWCSLHMASHNMVTGGDNRANTLDLMAPIYELVTATQVLPSVQEHLWSRKLSTPLNDPQERPFRCESCILFPCHQSLSFSALLFSLMPKQHDTMDGPADMGAQNGAASTAVPQESTSLLVLSFKVRKKIVSCLLVCEKDIDITVQACAPRCRPPVLQSIPPRSWRRCDHPNLQADP